jgi:monovalent cation/hydrogen antiporter
MDAGGEEMRSRARDPPAVSSAQLLTVLALAALTLSAVAVLRPFGVPAPVVLVVAGLFIGFLPFVPHAALDPHVVLLGFLPLLAYDAAITSSPTALVRNARSIGMLAVVLVVGTACGVAAVAHWLGGLSWPVAFVLGTAVGPTDAAAATSIARRLGLPRRLLTTLEGEALFNDATALVLYAAAVTAATSGHFSVLHTAGSIIYAAVAGAAIGLAVGFVGRWLRNRIDDPPIEIAGSILLAYGAYLPAEALHASGVLAAVAAGLYLGWHSGSGAFSARTRLQSAAFWQTLVFLVNAALFLFVGLSVHTFTAAARGPLGRLALTAVAAVGTVVVVRLVSLWALGFLTTPARGGLHRREGQDWRERLVLGWSGMRGAITLAAVLAVPTVTRAGAPLAGRDDLVYLGFGVIIATLIGQGMTLPLLVRRLRLREHPAVADAERLARVEMARAALVEVERASATAALPDELTDGLRAQYLARVRQLEASDEDEVGVSDDDAAVVVAELALRHDVAAQQRRTLSDLRTRGRIGVTTQRTLEHELDLQEAALTPSRAFARPRRSD